MKGVMGVACMFLIIAGMSAGVQSLYAGPEVSEDLVPLTWVDIPESNADYPAEDCPDGVGFTGEMSKYPTTNAQYAAYLTEALASEDIEIDGDYVIGKSGDYEGEVFYRFDGLGASWAGADNGGKPRISYSEGVFTVESGFEDHPLTYVSQQGAAAFASYYDWRLPTEWEWESVANYNDNRKYATGSSLYDNERFLANYRANGDDGASPSDLTYHSYVEHGTTPVEYFGYFGYGLADMAGNVLNWTSSTWSSTSSAPVLRGGCWNDFGNSVVQRSLNYPPDRNGANGFRVCR